MLIEEASLQELLAAASKRTDAMVCIFTRAEAGAEHGCVISGDYYKCLGMSLAIYKEIEAGTPKLTK